MNQAREGNRGHEGHIYQRKVSRKIICDLEALFAWLLVVGSKRRMELSALFDYELGPVTASIIAWMSSCAHKA